MITAARATSAPALVSDFGPLRQSIETSLHEIGVAGEGIGTLSRAVSGALESPGKRLRPLLALTTIELYRSTTREDVLAASALELLHSASLIIDDLPSMDNAAVRRGRPSTHALYGESTAILSALRLWSDAVRLAHADPPTVAVLARTASLLAEGQYLDLSVAPRSEVELRAHYYLKTGALFEAAGEIGALRAGAPLGERQALAEFGKRFGYAFQLLDDLGDGGAALTLLGALRARVAYEEAREEARQCLRQLPRNTARLEAFTDLALPL